MSKLRNVNTGRRIHVVNNLQARLSWTEAESITDESVEYVEAALLAIRRASPNRGSGSIVEIVREISYSLERTRR